jgi:hypothetical protein
MWTTLAAAIEQFHAHAPAMQDGLLLEWREGPRDLKRITAEEIRALLSPPEDRRAEVASR